SMPATYKRRITQKGSDGTMGFHVFHDPIGAFRRKAVYKNEKRTCKRVDIRYVCSHGNNSSSALGGVCGERANCRRNNSDS
ncbi:MAG: hypothetical protein LBQ71_06450, partial [Hungatella sp.]|nr:hypothetical protein [Hungatella sp.]